MLDMNTSMFTAPPKAKNFKGATTSSLKKWMQSLNTLDII